MQDKLQKLEEKINGVLMAIWLGLVALVNKIVPKKVFDFRDQTKLKTKTWFKKKVEQVRAKLIILKNKIITLKDYIMVKVDFVQKYPIREKVQVQVTVLKEYLLNTPLRNHVIWFSKKFSKFNASFWDGVDKVGRQQLGFAVTALIMITVGILSIYDSSRHIYNNEFQTRSPASAQEYDEKPAYQMYKRKTATVFKIQVPIYREKVKEVRNITIDFTVRTSTRFAKQYLEFHTQKLKDYFFTSVEPVTSSFPLEEEGKIVLKEKIHYELNNFLIQESVEGVVEEVNLIYSMGY